MLMISLHGSTSLLDNMLFGFVHTVLGFHRNCSVHIKKQIKNPMEKERTNVKNIKFTLSPKMKNMVLAVRLVYDNATLFNLYTMIELLERRHCLIVCAETKHYFLKLNNATSKSIAILIL